MFDVVGSYMYEANGSKRRTTETEKFVILETRKVQPVHPPAPYRNPSTHEFTTKNNSNRKKE